MRDILTSPRIEEIKHSRRVRNFRILIMSFVLLILFIGLLSYLSSNDKIVINNIVVSGNHILSTEDVKTITRDDLSGRYLYLFDKSNSLIYPYEKIYNDIIDTFPRIKTLSILSLIHI